MEKNDIEKIHKILLWKKKKYAIKSLFVQTKTLIVEFLSLHDVVREYLCAKLSLERAKEVPVFLPKNPGEKQKMVHATRPEILAYCFTDVLVSGDSSYFLTADKTKIFYEKFPGENQRAFVYNNMMIAFHSLTLAKIKNLPAKMYDLDAVFFGGTFSFNYYHFLLEILAKTKYISQLPDYKNLTYVFDSNIRENRNMKMLVDFFLKDYKVEFIDRSFYHHFRNIWFISTPNPTVPNIKDGTKFEAEYSIIDAESVAYLKNICLKNFDEKLVETAPVPRVFMARRSGFRKYNEDEIRAIAAKYGFRPIYFEDLNIHSQIFIMQNADFIVGASGAAWTNMIFAKPGTKGLTWLGSVWGDFSVFSTLAKIGEVDLNYLRYESKSNYFHEDYVIDPVVFEKFLRASLDS